ncbi:hypothetical protein N7516_010457 [Penicillium verrucosum]|uniref:uncharacterized protein n=1 Tax=Penicillium verrucosum TaxID=60171 RepID=UPI0025458638|nr:uncharacterized protein N7516_010457 [Penicillium verrucosum]KAJ5922754.1 hypothetical protein N7516_010457 [Penicillium verrucosum]
MPDNVCLGAKHRSPGFGSCDLEPAVIAGQHHPQAVDSRNTTQTRELPITETTDTAILDEHAFPGGEQIQTTEIATGIATYLDSGVLPLSKSRSTSSIQTTNCKGNGDS